MDSGSNKSEGTFCDILLAEHIECGLKWSELCHRRKRNSVKKCHVMTSKLWKSNTTHGCCVRFSRKAWSSPAPMAHAAVRVHTGYHVAWHALRYVRNVVHFAKVWTHSFIVRRAGLLWSQQDFEWWWSVPLSSASLLFCLICVYSSQFSILFWIMYLL